MTDIPDSNQDVAVAGVDSYTLAGQETTYGTAASSINRHFGVVQRVSPTKKNNLLEIRGFKGSTTGGRKMIKALGGKFETGLSVEFQPSNWAWLEDVLGTVSGTGAAGSPFVYSVATTVPSYTISTSIDLGSVDQNVNYLGCVNNSCTIRAAFGEPVSVTLEYMAASVIKSNTLTSAVALDTKDVFIFSGIALAWPSGTTVNHVVDSIEISLTNNSEILYGLGSRTGKKAIQKQFECGLKVTLCKEDDTFIDDFLGAVDSPATNPTRVANPIITFTNSATHSATFTLTGLTIDELGDDESYAEKIQEDITAKCEDISVSEVISA